jgi:anti-anti-sigma factor
MRSANRTFGVLDMHEHACLSYSDPADDLSAVADFVRGGLVTGDRVLLIVPAAEREPLLRSLGDAGVAVSPGLSSGQIEVRSVEESYRAAGRFDAGIALEMIAAEIDRARRDGYRALRVSGEPWRAACTPGERAAVVEYESQLRATFRQGEALALCRYREDACDPEWTRQVGAVHTLALETAPGRLSLRASGLTVRQLDDQTLVLGGELDAWTATAFGDLLERAATRSAQLRLDVGALEFVDVAGLRSIYVIAGMLGARGGRVMLDSASPSLRRTLRATGWRSLSNLEVR